MTNMLDAVPYFEFVQTAGVYTDSNMKTTALALPPIVTVRNVGRLLYTEIGGRPSQHFVK